MNRRSRLRWYCLLLYASTIGLVTFAHGPDAATLPWRASSDGIGRADLAAATTAGQHPAEPSTSGHEKDSRGDDSHDSRHCLVCHYLAQFHATLSSPPAAAGAQLESHLQAPLGDRPIAGEHLSAQARAPPAIG